MSTPLSACTVPKFFVMFSIRNSGSATAPPPIPRLLKANKTFIPTGFARIGLCRF